MTLEEFRQRKKDIRKDYPAPDGLTDAQIFRYYSKIVQGWIEELDNISDVEQALTEARATSSY